VDDGGRCGGGFRCLSSLCAAAIWLGQKHGCGETASLCFCLGELEVFFVVYMKVKSYGFIIILKLISNSLMDIRRKF
jgi:hypothetical protein